MLCSIRCSRTLQVGFGWYTEVIPLLWVLVHVLCAAVMHATSMAEWTDLTLQQTSLQDAIKSGWFKQRETLHRFGDALNMQAILLTALEIASAMLYLHSISIVHADLTGSSVLLTSSFRDERGFMAKASSF